MEASHNTLSRRMAAECIGTALLLAKVVGFIVMQLLGAASATALFRWLIPSLPQVAPSIVSKPN